MKTESRAKSIAIKALLAVVGACIAVVCAASFAALTVQEALHDVTNADGTGVPAQEAARIIRSDGAHPMGEKLTVYAENGRRVALDDVDAGSYEGFVTTFEAIGDDSEDHLQSAIDSGEVSVVYGNVLKASSLEALDNYFVPGEIGPVEPDYIMYVSDVDEAALGEAMDACLAGGDALAANQKELDLIKAQSVWNMGILGDGSGAAGEGRQVVVGVIDTGLTGTGTGDHTSSDFRHVDIDYDNQVLPGRNCNQTNPVEGTHDDNGHGTFVTGQIVASHNGIGVMGVAPKVKVRPYKVDNMGSFKASDVAAALDAVVADVAESKKEGSSAYGVDVVNMSVGNTKYNQTLKDACDNAAASGVILVASAGNEPAESRSKTPGIEYAPHYPASYDCVIGVSATTTSGTFDDEYSVHGEDNVFVSAPGTAYGIGTKSATSYGAMKGTSQASPLVASLGALAKSVDPSMTADDFRQLLKETSRDKGLVGYDPYYGWGLIDCNALISGIVGSEDNTDEGFLASPAGSSAGGVNWYITGSNSTTGHSYELVIEPMEGMSEGILNLKTSYDPSDRDGMTAAPWQGHAALVKSVHVSTGVSAMGSLDAAFFDMPSCESIDIANMDVSAVTTFSGTFTGLASLQTLAVHETWPDGLASFPEIPADPEDESAACRRWLDGGDPEGAYPSGASMPGGNASYSIGYSHTPADTEEVKPTCTEAGSKDGKHCGECGKVLVAPTVVDALGHEYGSVVTPPTCAAKGYTTHTCKHEGCDDAYIDTYVDALEHVWGEPEWDWPDPGASAKATSKCNNYDVCGRSLSVISSDISTTQEEVDGETYDVFKATANIGGKVYTETKRVKVEKPADPSDPGDPGADPGADPADPGTDPGDPSDPGNPSDPGTDPTGPGDPGADPGADPTDPGTDPGDPSDPGNPADPSDPSDPADPGADPADPGTDPGDPGDPSDPGTGPADPSDPGTKPTDPTNPPANAPISVVGDAIGNATGSASGNGGKIGASIKDLPANLSATDLQLEINASPEKSSIRAALQKTVEKAANNMNSTVEFSAFFDVNLFIAPNTAANSSSIRVSMHDNFGKLTLSFPVDPKFNGRTATVQHCVSDNVDNIQTVTDKAVVKDGLVTVEGIESLSSFSVHINKAKQDPKPPSKDPEEETPPFEKTPITEISDPDPIGPEDPSDDGDEASATSPAKDAEKKNPPVAGDLSKTGDSLDAAGGAMLLVAVCGIMVVAACAAFASMMRGRRD